MTKVMHIQCMRMYKKYIMDIHHKPIILGLQYIIRLSGTCNFLCGAAYLARSTEFGRSPQVSCLPLTYPTQTGPPGKCCPREC